MTEVLERRFAAIGARLKVAGPARGAPRIDVRSDRRGEFFDIRFVGTGDSPELEVVDVAPRDRHLLLLVRQGAEKSKFLCGHDERHWFVAAVPEDAWGVSGVATAKAALQPPEARRVVARKRPKDAFRRRNAAYVRQGEWFFVPAPEARIGESLVLRDEPLMRSGGTSHRMEYAYRRGGEAVYVNGRRQFSEAQYAGLTDARRKSGAWMRLVRDPEVFAKGAIRHPDHATIRLAGWHRVLMNTEHRSRAKLHVTFID